MRIYSIFCIVATLIIVYFPGHFMDLVIFHHVVRAVN